MAMPVLQVLLQGISSHVVDFDAEQAARFRGSVQEIADGFKESVPISELLVRARVAMKTLDDYNRQANSYIRSQRAELHSMLKMLADTLTGMTRTSVGSVSKLQEFENQLESATEIVDVRVLKMRLGDCLQEIRKDAQQQQKESERVIDQLTKEIEKVRMQAVTNSDAADRDLTTGLRMRVAAERVLTERCSGEKPSFVALLSIERIQTYNARFGRTIGDQILRFFAETIKTRLGEGDWLFRWTGPNLLLVMKRPVNLDQGRCEVKRIADHLPEFTAETDYRTAMLPISCRFGVFATTPPMQLLIKKIDMFTTIHAAPEQAQS